MQQPFTTRPEIRGTFGAVATTHWIASTVAMSVLERGGNAFDAAVAAGFVLQVVEPHLNGPAGEAPILLWSEADRAVHVVCGQGVAPAAATVERFADLGLDAVPGTGLLAATVPGAFGAWALVLERWGTWRLRDVLAFAISYAGDGFPVVPHLALTIATVADLFRQEWPTSAAVWLDRGRPPAPGSRLRLPTLAGTYERLVREAEQRGSGREGEIRAAVDLWYEGFVAEAVARFCRTTAWLDTSGERHGGLLDADDLARWRPTVEAPVSYDYRGCTVFKTGPWGQGPVFLQQLALLDALGLAAVPDGSADHLHLVVEASKLAFADREAWYGDSGAVLDLVDHLLAPGYNAARAGLVGDRASTELRPGSVAGRRPVLPSGAGQVEGGGGSVGLGEPAVGSLGQVRGDTCHVDVVDRHGNMVSATPSGGWLQSSPALPELGFCLGTRAQMFWLEPGLPSTLRPGARPRTTLSPSLAFREGEPWLAFGTPGGDQQDQWSLAFLLSLLHGGLGLQAAIDAPAFHSEHAPSSFYPRTAHPGRLVVEERLDAGVVADLRARGHDVVVSGPWTLGRLSAVSRGPDGLLRAAANPRGAQGYAVGR